MTKFKYPCFQALDIFGVPPLFTIRGRATFQTQIGSSLTIVCATLILTYILFFIDEMINHKSPNLNSITYYDETPSEIILNKNNFSFVFGLQTKEYKNFIDESIYKVNAYQSKLILNKNGVYNYENQPLKVIKCDEYKFEIIPEKFKKLPIENLYCLNNNISLKGDYMQESWNFIQFNFMKCVNSTENDNNCKSENEINTILNEGFIGMFIPDNALESSKFKIPYKTYIRNLYKEFSIKYYENILLYFKLVEVITDSGYFFDDKKSVYFPSYDYSQNNLDINDLINFLTITIRVSSKREIHKRSYIKVQTIFSNVGGMLKIVLLIGEYSVYFIRMLLYKNYILEFFNLDESEIRLKEIRAIYKLSGNHTTKSNFESIFPMVSNMEINTSFNLFNQNKSNFQFQKKNIKNDENSPAFNTSGEANNKDNVEHASPKENNFFLSNEFFTRKTKSKDVKTTNTLLYRGVGKSSVVNKIHNRISKLDTIISNDDLNLIKQKSGNLYHNIKGVQKTIISNKSNFMDKHKSLLSNQSLIKTNTQNLRRNLIIPKTNLRVIKIPGFLSDFVCKKNTVKTIKQVNENYKEIQFLLDIVHYLKSQNELSIIERYLFTEEQRKILSHTYTFKADFGLERKGYEYMIKHKKNKIDEKEVKETLLSKNNKLNAETKKLI